jgi:hypothetical protein
MKCRLRPFGLQRHFQDNIPKLRNFLCKTLCAGTQFLEEVIGADFQARVKL